MPYHLTPDDINQIRRLISIHRALLERDARRGEVLDGVELRLEAMTAIMQELITEVSKLANDQQRIEALLLLERTGHGESDRAGAIRQEIQQEHDDIHLRKLLLQQQRNLERLKEREARYGGNAPLDLLNQIEEVQAAIDKIKNELG